MAPLTLHRPPDVEALCDTSLVCICFGSCVLVFVPVALRPCVSVSVRVRVCHSNNTYETHTCSRLRGLPSRIKPVGTPGRATPE